MFNTYMGMLVWPMIALGWVVNLMQRGSASLERINQILRGEAAHRSAAAQSGADADVRGEIEFRKRRSYEYPAGRRWTQGEPADSGGHHGRGRRTYRHRQEHAGRAWCRG